MKWWMTSRLRPSNSSANVRVPSSVSKRYSFSIRTQGSSRRRCASSSPSRVCSFSRASSSSRAAAHSSRVPTLRSVTVFSPFVPSQQLGVTDTVLSSRNGQSFQQRRVLALERLGRTAAPALRHRRSHRIGEDLVLPVLQTLEDCARDRLARGLRDVEASGHVRVGRAGQDGVYPHAPWGQKGP